MNGSSLEEEAVLVPGVTMTRLLSAERKATANRLQQRNVEENVSILNM